MVATEAIPTLALVLACAVAGTGATFLLFGVARRDARTRLPDAWRPWAAVAGGLLCGVLGWRFCLSWSLPAMLMLPVFGVVLAATDLRSKLLPNPLVLWFGATIVALLGAASVATGEWERMAGGAAGALAMFLLYLLPATIAPGSMGMGDVKLAAVLGLIGGYAGWTAWFVGIMGGFVLGGAVGVLAMCVARGRRIRQLPFAPPMVAAAVIALLGWA